MRKGQRRSNASAVGWPTIDRAMSNASTRRGRHLIQYWHTADLPDEVAADCRSFAELNPDFVYIRFDESSAEEFIARHLSERECAAFRSCAVPAMQADYLRYCAVLTLGGIYCDVDHRCRAPLSALLEDGVGGRLYMRPNEVVINGFFAFADANHLLLRLAVDIATAAVEQRLAEDVWLTTGPGIFTTLYHLSAATSMDGFLTWWAQLHQNYDAMRICAENACEIVGDLDRARNALADVEVAPLAESRSWIGGPSGHYKSSQPHWSAPASSIFR